MAKGDIFEPVFEIVARVFLPRHGGSSIVDELSWAWLASLIFVMIVYETLRRYFKDVENEQGEEAARTLKKRLRVCRYFLWASLFLSLVMFRFDKLI